MRIIKPYGRSHTEDTGAGQNSRILRLRPPSRERRDIEEFARSHDELVIAQWISTIDKIATKPVGKNGPTTAQRAFRERLGKAAWAHLGAPGLLPGLSDPERKAHLTKLWKRKIAPYGSAEYEPRGKTQPPSPKGRWYDRFAGIADVADVDIEDVVAKIHEHLYEAEYRISAAAAKRGSGRIAARARSIAGNVLKPSPPVAGGNAEAGWTEEDKETYARVGNVAGDIREAAKRREDPRDGARRVTRDVAGAALFAHYARLFPGDDGKPLSIRATRERFPGRFNLHMAVKDCYARILKHHNKDQKAHGAARRKVSTLLPGTMDELFVLVDSKTDNRDLGALVRLGKVIHYEASGGGDDRPADVVANWPADVTHSRYWTSDGQAEIKRNEAFVRVWRHVLALARSTLKDWADPKGHIRGDILLNGLIVKATGEDFDPDGYCRKLDLLFGSRARPFKGNGDAGFQRTILKLALERTARLRHNSFHFNGLGGFVRVLQLLQADDVISVIRDLWVADHKDQAERLRQTMRGAHFEYFFDEARNRKLFEALSDPSTATIALPRFRRVLQRADNAWTKDKDDLGFPRPANRKDLENHARLCQYTALKLVYERPFRTWLTGCGTLPLNGFIDRAVDRATDAARRINAKIDEDFRDVIVARADGLGRLAEGDDIQVFFFNLSAETASEMRVQRGYDSDPVQARKQAKYIEDLKCDVLALAFADYLKQAGFDFLLEFSEDTRKAETVLFDLEGLPTSEVDASGEDWQAMLYFLIHLVPVDEIGKLLHQMRKWEILAGRPAAGDHRRQGAERAMVDRARRVQAVLGLYLEMHDAKFEGGEAAIIGIDDFKGLFETPELFSRVFPAQTDDDDDHRIPRRGLREIMRFGHLPALWPVFEQYPVKAGDVAAIDRAERVTDGKSGIAATQEARESLHDKWSRNRKEFDADDRRAYVEALVEVVRHRHLAAHKTLTNHVRLYRVMMAVLGRLVDYSGLWERDVYFATLALIQRSGQFPTNVFTSKGIEKLEQGRIVDALRELHKTDDAKSVKDGLRRHFGAVYEKRNANVEIRNFFAHFDMLKPNSLPVDLTACVDRARQLMAYDRKLKNAVSRSVKELLHREGLAVDWTMDTESDHHLSNARVATRQAPHLGKVKLFERQDRSKHDRPRYHFINEDLHGTAFVRMVAALFGGEAREQPSIAELNLNGIDWRNSGSRKQTESGKKHANRPQNGYRNTRNRGRNRQNQS